MEIVTPILIYVVVPLIGLLVFTRLFAGVYNSSIYAISLINTAHFGGWLIFFLTALFWQSSGMVSLGFFYLIFIAPVLSAGFAFYILRQKKNLTDYRYALVTSIFYIPFLALLFAMLFFASKLH